MQEQKSLMQEQKAAMTVSDRPELIDTRHDTLLLVF
jgi:hypothetical protein